MRLIDADALKKAIDIPFLDNMRLGKIINDAPTIDAVEVVRCKECVHMEMMDKTLNDVRYVFCNKSKQHRFMPSDGYCSYGERRTMTDKMTNQEAIDRLKLIRSPYMEVAVDVAIEALQAEPKTGEWIDTEFLRIKECSCCHTFRGKIEAEDFDFCPNCGARMDGGKE